jgi:hypothetical protein
MIPSFQKSETSTLRKMMPKNSQRTVCSITQIPKVSTATDDGQELLFQDLVIIPANSKNEFYDSVK